jgi:hypothetical protein
MRQPEWKPAFGASLPTYLMLVTTGTLGRNSAAALSHKRPDAFDVEVYEIPNVAHSRGVYAAAVSADGP